MRNATRFLLPLIAVLWLAGCSTTKTPDYSNLPSKDSIQAGEEITVEKSENVYAIARKYGVSMRSIIVLNDLKAPYALKAGQRLTLPLKEGVAPGVPASAPRGTIEATPLSPYNSAVTSAPLDPPTSGAVSSAPLTAPSAAPARPAAPQPLETTVSSSTKSRPAQIASAAAPRSVAAPVPQPAKEVESSSKDDSASSDFSARPPVQGPIILAFGNGNDGINIGAPKGSSVVAAAGGIVVYAGNDMKGFGNLILIRHEDGWVTAYAHLDRTLVTKDAVVAAGDQIGTVGTTGGVSAPQLHFEVRQNSKPIDPKGVLKP